MSFTFNNHQVPVDTFGYFEFYLNPSSKAPLCSHYLSIVNTTGRRFWRSSSAQRRVSDRGLHVRPCDRRRYKSVVALTVAAIPRAQAAHHWHGSAPRILAGRTFCTRFCLTAYASACRYLWRRTAAARHTTHCVEWSLVDVI